MLSWYDLEGREHAEIRLDVPPKCFPTDRTRVSTNTQAGLDQSSVIPPPPPHLQPQRDVFDAFRVWYVCMEPILDLEFSHSTQIGVLTPSRQRAVYSKVGYYERIILRIMNATL